MSLSVMTTPHLDLSHGLRHIGSISTFLARRHVRHVMVRPANALGLVTIKVEYSG